MGKVLIAKLCPFCGEKPEELHIDGSWGYYPAKSGIGCNTPGCVRPRVLFYEEEWDDKKHCSVTVDAMSMALNIWNRRSDHA